VETKFRASVLFSGLCFLISAMIVRRRPVIIGNVQKEYIANGIREMLSSGGLARLTAPEDTLVLACLMVVSRDSSRDNELRDEL
jgi:hypothetical protein